MQDWISYLLLKESTKKTERFHFIQQLSNLLKQRIPLAEAVGIILKDIPPRKFRAVASSIHSDLQKGERLSSALSKFPRYFPSAYTSFIAAGEQTENLPTAVDHLADYLKHRDISLDKLILAVYFPITFLFGVFLILNALAIVVAPKFLLIFEDYAAEIPKSSAALFFSFFTIKNLPFLTLIYLFLIIISVSIFYSLYYYQGRKSLFLFKFSTIMKMLFNSNLPIAQQRRIILDNFRGVLFNHAVSRSFDRIESGESISAAFEKSRYFPQTFKWLLATGEARGDIPAAFADIAKFYDIKADTKFSLLINILPPVLVIITAIIVGIVAVAFFSFFYLLIQSLLF